jgi:hypothetical protein
LAFKKKKRQAWSQGFRHRKLGIKKAKVFEAALIVLNSTQSYIKAKSPEIPAYDTGVCPTLNPSGKEPDPIVQC